MDEDPYEWSQDEEEVWVHADECSNCFRKFTFIVRRHHCRICCNSFCQKCSTKRLAIPEHGYEKKQRVCDECYENRTKEVAAVSPSDAGTPKKPESASPATPKIARFDSFAALQEWENLTGSVQKAVDSPSKPRPPAPSRNDRKCPPRPTRGDKPAVQPRGDKPAVQPRGDKPAVRPRGDKPAVQPRGDKAAANSQSATPSPSEPRSPPVPVIEQQKKKGQQHLDDISADTPPPPRAPATPTKSSNGASMESSPSTAKVSVEAVQVVNDAEDIFDDSVPTVNTSGDVDRILDEGPPPLYDSADFKTINNSDGSILPPPTPENTSSENSSQPQVQNETSPPSPPFSSPDSPDQTGASKTSIPPPPASPPQSSPTSIPPPPSLPPPPPPPKISENSDVPPQIPPKKQPSPASAPDSPALPSRARKPRLKSKDRRKGSLKSSASPKVDNSPKESILSPKVDDSFNDKSCAMLEPNKRASTGQKMRGSARGQYYEQLTAEEHIGPMLGWLEKYSRRGMYKGLHKRFFTLHGSTLKYYKDTTCKHLRTKIELHGGTLVHRLSKTMFTIKSGDENLSLVAEDECTCDSWVDALKARVEAASARKKSEDSGGIHDSPSVQDTT